MSQITLTASMRNNLLSLQRTQALFDMTQERLSTGRRVNTALDNPASFFAAQSLNSRAAGLENLLDSMGQATQTLRAADESITTLTQMVEQARALANTARDTANTHSVTTSSVNLTTVGAPTNLAGIEAGDTFSIRLGAADNLTGTRNLALTQTMGQLGFSAEAGTAYLAIRVGDNAFVNVNITSAMTIEDLTKSINENSRLIGLVNASVSSDGRFVLQTTDAQLAVTVQAIGNTQVTRNDTVVHMTSDGTIVAAATATGTTVTIAAGTLAQDVGGTAFTSWHVSTAGVVTGSHESIATASNRVAVGDLNAVTGALGVGGDNNAASILGLDVGYTIDIRAAGQARIVGDAITQSAGATISQGGVISPTPASIRVTVGDRSELITFAADTTFEQAATMINNITGIDTATFAGAGANPAGVLTVTGDAGQAIRIEDVTGNFARHTGIQTADFVRPLSGGVQDLVDRINLVSTDITARVDNNGNLRIAGTNGEDLIITDTMNAAGRIGGGATNLGIEGLANNGVNVRRSYSEQFNQILTQIDMMVQNNDTGYRGVNLLNGEDLVVNFNEARTSNLLVRGAVLDARGLGMNNSINEWRGNADIDRALADVDTAMARMSTQASEWGQNLNIITTREDFTSSMINTLTAGADKLTLADMNEEAANMLALQIRQQLGTNALALASQSQQAVLALF